MKDSVHKHKLKLGVSLNAMIDECQNEIEKIENDVTFSNPENLDNLDKDNETSVVNK